MSFFGAQSTPAFGSSAPPFGATSASLFGATPSTGPGLAFSSPFGASAATPSPFGQSSSAGAFAFGAPQSSSGGFGGFGAFGPPQSSAAAAFSFGASQQSSAAAPLFGTPQSSASAFGGFGAPQSSAAAFGFGGFNRASSASLFGATPSQAQPFGNAFGGGQPGAQAQMQLAPAGAPPGMWPRTHTPGMQPSDPTAAAEVEALGAAFGLSNDATRTRFSHLFLNVVDNPAARQRPPNVDALRWRQAIYRAGGEHNKDGLWPVPAMGFGDLLARKAAQDTAIQQHEERMKQAQRAVAELVRKQDILVYATMDKVRREHQILSARLLALFRKIDLLEARSASALGLWDDSSVEATAAIARSLNALEGKLAPSAPNGLQRRVDSLASAAHLRAGSEATISAEDAQMTADDLAGAYGVLKSQAQAVTRLQHVLTRVNRDMSILAEAQTQQAY